MLLIAITSRELPIDGDTDPSHAGSERPPTAVMRRDRDKDGGRTNVVACGRRRSTDDPHEHAHFPQST